MNEASLSLYEATELFYIVLETQDRFFEFWITATFAVIIACHLGSSILTRSFSVMISLMYVAFSINMIGRWFLAAGAVSRYRNDMASQSGIQRIQTGSPTVCVPEVWDWRNEWLPLWNAGLFRWLRGEAKTIGKYGKY